MKDYSKCRLYAIRSHESPEIYIGATTATLSRRFSGHKTKFKRNTQYVSSFEVLKYPSAYIELIEEVSCENKEQLNRLEGALIRSTVCVNKNIAGQTHSEYDAKYRILHAEKIKLYRNTDAMKAYQHEYYLAHK